MTAANQSHTAMGMQNQAMADALAAQSAQMMGRRPSGAELELIDAVMACETGKLSSDQRVLKAIDALTSERACDAEGPTLPGAKGPERCRLMRGHGGLCCATRIAGPASCRWEKPAEGGPEQTPPPETKPEAVAPKRKRGK